MTRGSTTITLCLWACMAVAAPPLARADESRAPLTLSFIDPPPTTTTPTPPTPAEIAAAKLPEHFNPDWTIEIDPLLWFVGPSGKLKLPVTSGTGPGPFTTEGDKASVNDLNLQTTRARPAGMLTVASGKWRFSFWGSDYDLDRADTTVDFAGRLGAVAFTPGDHLKLNLSFGFYEATVGYRVWDYDFVESSKLRDAALDAQIVLHLLGGARLYDVEVGAENLGSGARADAAHVFAEPIVGVRAEAILDTQFSVILQLSAGGLPLYSTESYTLDVLTAFQWRPLRNLGVQIGWRQLAFDLSDGRDLDKFQYTGRLAGLFAGVTIRF